MQDEGGYSNNPNDNGGPTNLGITLTDYRLYIKRNGNAEDVKNLTQPQAINIYKTKYWDALNCDSLPSGVDYTVFDYAVNSGTARPRKALERFKTQTGTNLIDSINNERASFLKSLAASQQHDQEFLKGWLARVERVRSISKEMAKDKTSGVAATVVTAGVTSIVAGLHQNLSLEMTVAALAAISIAIGVGVHYYINKGKQ